MAEPETTRRDHGGRWTKGTSGNPAGRPAGARHRSIMIAQELLDGECETLVRKLIEMALDGDATALRLAVERLVPARRERHIEVELPELLGSFGAAEAMALLVAAVAQGELTPAEGKTVGGLVEAFARVKDIQTLAERLEAVERELKDRKNG